MLSLNSSGIYCAIFIPLSHLIKLLHYYNYSIFRGSLNYLIINAILSIGSIIMTFFQCYILYSEQYFSLTIDMIMTTLQLISV